MKPRSWPHSLPRLPGQFPAIRAWPNSAPRSNSKSPLMACKFKSWTTSVARCLTAAAPQSSHICATSWSKSARALVWRRQQDQPRWPYRQPSLRQRGARLQQLGAVGRPGQCFTPRTDCRWHAREQAGPRVVGMAASLPFDADNPLAPTNRRISILVMTKDAEERLLGSKTVVAGRGSALQPNQRPASRREIRAVNWRKLRHTCRNLKIAYQKVLYV